MTNEKIAEVLDKVIEWYDNPSHWVKGAFAATVKGPTILGGATTIRREMSKGNISCACVEGAIMAFTRGKDHQAVNDALERYFDIYSLWEWNDAPYTSIENIKDGLTRARDRIRQTT